MVKIVFQVHPFVDFFVLTGSSHRASLTPVMSLLCDTAIAYRSMPVTNPAPEHYCRVDQSKLRVDVYRNFS